MSAGKPPPPDDEEVPPPSPEEIAAPPSWAGDERAALEVRLWSDEERLRGVKLGNEIRWHRAYGVAIVLMMWFFVIVFIASLGVWIWHYLTPWPWLTADQLSKIQSVIFSGSLGAIVSAFMQRQLAKQ